MHHCLVNEDIAVCKIKNLFLNPTFMKTMDNLESSKSLTSTGSHYHKYTLLPSCDGLYCAINCYTLIISWFMAMGIIVERSFYYIEFIRCIVLRCQITVV